MPCVTTRLAEHRCGWNQQPSMCGPFGEMHGPETTPDQSAEHATFEMTKRQAASVIAVLAAPAAVGAFFFTESIATRVGIVSAVGMLLAGVAVALLAATSVRSSVTMPVFAAYLFWSLALPGLGVVVLAPAYQRSACGAWLFVAEDFLASYRNCAFEVIEQDEELPRSIALWVADGDIDDTYFTTPLCGRFTLDDIRVGEWSLGDLQAGRVTREQIGEAAENLSPGDWERVGPFFLCREAAALRSDHPDLIIGFQQQAEKPNEEYWAFVFANWRTRTIWADHLEFVVAADAAARRELGLARTPEFGPIAIEMARLRAMEPQEQQEPE